MSTATPEQVLESIVTGINSGDLESLMPLYESEAGFAGEPGVLAHRAPGIGEALSGFISMNGTLNIDVTRVLEADDLALVIGVWFVRWHGTGRRAGAACGKERGRPASSERRHLALRDRQPVGNRLNSRVGRSSEARHQPGGPQRPAASRASFLDGNDFAQMAFSPSNATRTATGWSIGTPLAAPRPVMRASTST